MDKSRKTKVVIAFILILLLIILAATSCKKKSAYSTSQTSSTPPKISVQKPVIKPVVLYKTYPGYLQSNAVIDLVARVSGYLQKQHFEPGAMVKKDQLLFVIEPTLYQNQVDEAQASVNSAQATLDYAQNNYQRMQEAAASDAISQIDLIQAYTNVNTAQASLLDAESQLESAKTNLGYCYIKAPVAGSITVNQIDVGNYVSGSASAVTLATLYDNSRMYAYFNIEDNQYLAMLVKTEDENLQASLPKQVTLNLPGSDYPSILAKPDYVSPDVSLSTGTLNLRAVIDNAANVLKNGMYVTVDLPYDENPKAVLILNSATATDQLGRYVYVVNDKNEVEYRHIETGQVVDDSLIVINKGLNGNEMYVTKALLKVRSGMKVEPVME